MFLASAKRWSENFGHVLRHLKETRISVPWSGSRTLRQMCHNHVGYLARPHECETYKRLFGEVSGPGSNNAVYTPLPSMVVSMELLVSVEYIFGVLYFVFYTQTNYMSVSRMRRTLSMLRTVMR